MPDIPTRGDPLDCPCLLAEKPVAPCVPGTCFHFSRGAACCHHCRPVDRAVRVCRQVVELLRPLTPDERAEVIGMVRSGLNLSE